MIYAARLRLEYHTALSGAFVSGCVDVIYRRRSARMISSEIHLRIGFGEEFWNLTTFSSSFFPSSTPFQGPFFEGLGSGTPAVPFTGDSHFE